MQSVMKFLGKNIRLGQILLFCIILLAIPATAMAATTVSANINAGILKGFDGSLHTLNEYTGKGKWTVVMIWASDCHACNAEAKQYVKFHNEHKDKDATILGISLDGEMKKSEANAFIERHGVTFPNLIEEPEKIENLYASISGQRWVGTPSFLVYSPKGELLAAQIGAVPTSIIESFIESENAKESAQ